MSIEERINDVLDRVRPFLINDGGSVEFVKFVDGIAYVKLLGACSGCSYADVTLNDTVATLLLNEVPEVNEVRNIDGSYDE